MEQKDELWGLAMRSARGFLRRFEDLTTRNERDDLVQETACSAWRWAQSARDPGRFEAAVRTIARRTRCRFRTQRQRQREHEARSLEYRPVEPPSLVVVGHCVPSVWLLDCLDRVLEGLCALDRRLLLGMHEGFCCAELAVRFRCSEKSVKVRIHRTRRRVQMEIERAVLDAEELDVVSQSNP